MKKVIFWLILLALTFGFGYYFSFKAVVNFFNNDENTVTTKFFDLSGDSQYSIDVQETEIDVTLNINNYLYDASNKITYRLPCDNIAYDSIDVGMAIMVAKPDPLPLKDRKVIKKIIVIDKHNNSSGTKKDMSEKNVPQTDTTTLK